MAVIQSRYGVDSLQLLDVERILISKVQAAEHTEQVTDGKHLPSWVPPLQFRQVFGHGIVDAFYITFIHCDAAQQRCYGFGHGEYSRQTVGREIAPVHLVNDIVVMDDHYPLRGAFIGHRFRERQVYTMWRLIVEMEGIDPICP